MNQSQEGTAAMTPTATLAARAPRMWVGAVLLAAGLGLIVIGGCFLIGIWIMIGAHGMDAQATTPWSPASKFLMVFLYVLASACLLGALALVVFGARSLVGLLKS